MVIVMKKWFPRFLTCFALAVSAVALSGADQTGERQPKRDDAGKLAIAEPAVSKDSRKTNSGPSREERDKRREEFNKLTPEEREAKRKEIKGRLEKRICELRSKQTNATITTQETRELERREQILKRFDQAPALTAEPAAPATK
jgi:hypothetical protein